MTLLAGILYVSLLATYLLPSRATSISDIQGSSFLSPYNGQLVTDVTGVVAAKVSSTNHLFYIASTFARSQDKYGFWFVGEPSDDLRVSNGLRVYSANLARSVSVGELVRVDGKVTEYRNPYRPNDLYLTELEPIRLQTVSTGNTVVPVVLGEGRRVPPTTALSAFDNGADGWLSVPSNRTLVENTNATLQPDKYGLDFWESLEGQLVTVKSPVAIGFPDRFGSFWVHGNWPVSGKNSRGGLTLAFDSNHVPYSHSETILIGHPLDNSRNPRPYMGVTLSDITGVVTYQFGFYYILPLTAASVTSAPDAVASPAIIASSTNPCEVTIGDYNVENMAPRSRHIPRIADHIANYLNSPDIVFVQEIQDDSGSSDNGVVSANKTLGALTKAIAKASGGVQYEFVNVPPLNNMDGGKPGSNIRVAYLWRPEKVSLVPGYLTGNATQPTEVIHEKDGKLALSMHLTFVHENSLNPGRVDPMSPAWEETRKPLAAAWQATTGERFYTVNVHFSSKRDTDVNASIILAGDMNEFVQTRSVFHPLSHLLADIHQVSGAVPPEERYTYVYDQHTQEIDQMFVSDAVARRGAAVEHVHVNTWARSVGERASDHDPSVAKVRVCGGGGEQGLAGESSGMWIFFSLPVMMFGADA
ncbi:hypothetical protein PHLCEN_2v11189 [Hermanssonia centrifuga]|uniref:Endonuclease/exonuclease/phosphatase domain-containing protein n=1 Tax=Hermanssonia centrifuga TaxID=98765 RepID=A0A2R6NLR4_9APHY|nr:hypothetical protein PHLCEN_2v11189 [Hermanssonia centrifuga]